jgi:hypothetical protein
MVGKLEEEEEEEEEGAHNMSVALVVGRGTPAPS